MKASDLRKAIAELTVWESRGRRAPHKPLLLLFALGQLVMSGERWLRFRSVEPKLKRLLEDFGPPRRQHRPEQPYWRLQSDGSIWSVIDNERFPLSADGAPTAKTLRDRDASAGFSESAYQLLKHDPSLKFDIAERLLVAHFPVSVHEELKVDLGLESLGDHLKNGPQTLRPRDPRFRETVLHNYNCQCAICGYSVRLGNALVGLDAAHIKWHQAGGPSEARNGLALCSLHHQMFDRGIFALDAHFRVIVSPLVNGSDGSILQHLGVFEKRTIRFSRNRDLLPAEEYLAWHREQVFRAT